MLITIASAVNLADTALGNQYCIRLEDGTELITYVEGFELDEVERPNHLLLHVDHYPGWVVDATGKHLEELQKYILELTSDDPLFDPADLLDDFARYDLMLAWLEDATPTDGEHSNARVVVCIGTSLDLIAQAPGYPVTRIELESPIAEIRQIESLPQEVSPAL